MASWTEMQNLAISVRKGEYVVSASAGTGKTSVIIERAWQLINTGYANVDELLIVTFTDKAAAELLARLQEKLNAEFALASKTDKKSFLLNQLNRLGKAQISTIHSLCLRIVRENYHLLGLSHNVRCIPPEQLTLLQHRIIEDIFEQMYADKSVSGETFRKFIDIYGNAHVDGNIKQLILELNSFLVTTENPQKWIDDVHNFIRLVKTKDFNPSDILSSVFRDNWILETDNFIRQLEIFKDKLSTLGLDKILLHIDEIKEILQYVRENLSNNIFDKFDAIEKNISSTPRISKHPEWDEYRKDFSDFKKSIKTFLVNLQSICTFTIDEITAQIPFIEIILFLVQQFQEKVLQEKKALGVIDYDDILQLAFKLLTDEPSVTKHYRELFKFIMVDEYQDINELQDAIIRSLTQVIRKGKIDNLFVVGDVKQSIYRFRLAEPEIFQTLCHRANNSNALTRIDLKENFRSRQSVIDTVNALFTLMMAGGAMEIEYDAQHNLVYAANYPDKERYDKTELHIIERKPKDTEDINEIDDIFIEYDAQEREAFLAAQQIENLLSSEYEIYDKTLGKNRAIRPNDIAILLRTLKGTANKFAYMLQKRAIPVSVSQIEAFLDYTEIADIVSLLRVIVNPFEDISLVSVLRSPIVEASAEELAEIRRFDKGYFFSALQKYVREKEQSGGKFSRFIERLQRWRELSNRLNPSELIRQIFIDTGYVDYASIMPQSGEIAEENLKQFLELAKDFSEAGDVDISDFVEYLTLIGENDLSFSNINTPAATGVQIMSVHASKGLEFPVVIIAGLGKQFNMQSVRTKILFDRKLLIGLQILREDEEKYSKSQWQETLIYSAISQYKQLQLKAEELRLLYVAMTRAKEKLILIGNADIPKLVKQTSNIKDKYSLSAALPNQNTPLLWIMSAIIAENPCISADDIKYEDSVLPTQISTNLIDISLYPSSVQQTWDIKGTKAGTSSEKLIAKLSEEPDQASDERTRITSVSNEAKALLEKLDWQYPYKDLTHIPATISVTEFAHQKHQADDRADPMDVPQIEIFDDDFNLLDIENPEYIEKGNAWHVFMEKINLGLEMTEKNIAEEIDRLTEQRIITVQQKKFIDIQRVKNFFRTVPGKLMLEYHEQVKREQPFTYMIPANSLPDALRIGKSDESVLIHGVIDCLIMLNGKIVIIDYKTSQITSDRVDEKTELYRPQVELYARAMSDILNCPVDSVWLYFTEPNSAVKVL